MVGQSSFSQNGLCGTYQYVSVIYSGISNKIGLYKNGYNGRLFGLHAGDYRTYVQMNACKVLAIQRAGTGVTIRAKV